MDSETYFYLLAAGCFILIICVYLLYNKTKKLYETQTQFQKHLMYQQSLIEKHNTILRNLSLGQPVTEETKSLPVNTISSQSIETPEQPKIEEKPSPISTLLPMISSLMGMMNNIGEDGVESDLESEMDEEENEKKIEMVNEIQTELKELKNIETDLPKEGRIEEEQKSEEKNIEVN